MKWINGKEITCRTVHFGIGISGMVKVYAGTELIGLVKKLDNTLFEISEDTKEKYNIEITHRTDTLDASIARMYLSALDMK